MKSKSPILTVIIPILNEENTINTIIQRIFALGMELEIIIVDDGSTDNTPEILRSLKSECYDIIP